MQSIISLIKKVNKKYIFLTVVAIIIIIILVYLVSKENEHFGVDNFTYDLGNWNVQISSTSYLSNFTTGVQNQIMRFGNEGYGVFTEKIVPSSGIQIDYNYFTIPLYYSTTPSLTTYFNNSRDISIYTKLNYNPKYWKSIGIENGTITRTDLNEANVRYGIVKPSGSIYFDFFHTYDANFNTINATNFGNGLIPTNPNNNLYIYEPPPSGRLSGPLAVKSIIINNKFATDYMYYDFNQGKTVNGGRPLQISQLAVYAMVGSNLINVAATSNGGVASAFSSFPGLNPSHAIDGTLSPKVFSGNAYHSSGGGNNEWWYLELNNTYNVHRIVYYNRSECCQIRAKGSQIELFSTNQTNKVDTTFPIYTHTFDESLIQEIEIFYIPPPTTTTQYQPTTTRPTTTRPPTTTGPTTTRPTTTQYQPTTTQYQPTTTQYQPTTTQYQPTTTQYQPTTTQYKPTTTQYQPTTTQYQPTTTQYQPTTTQYQPTTTQYQPTTGAQGAESLVPTTTGARGAESLVPTTTEARCDSRPTTSNHSLMDDLLSDMNMLMRDIQNNIPKISSAHVIDLVNSGIDINTLTASFSYSNRDNNSDSNENYKYQDPSIEIDEVNFDGSSNVYSPYIYYDKNSSERFDSVKKTVR